MVQKKPELDWGSWQAANKSVHSTDVPVWSGPRNPAPACYKVKLKWQSDQRSLCSRGWERPFSSWYFGKLLPIRVHYTEPDGPIIWFVIKQLFFLFKKEISHILLFWTSSCQIQFLTSEKWSWSFSYSFALSFFLDFFFSFSLTVSNCVAGYRGAASPSAMLLDLWFPVKHNESYIRLFKVRWCTICSQAWKTLSNRDQQKAIASPVSSEYSYSPSGKEADDSAFQEMRTSFAFTILC